MLEYFLNYLGKYIPAITHTIYEENQGDPDIFINLQGFAIGNGATDPVNSFIYAEYMYQIGLIDEQDRDIMLEMEEDFFAAIADDDYLLAQQVSPYSLLKKEKKYFFGLGRLTAWSFHMVLAALGATTHMTSASASMIRQKMTMLTMLIW